MKRRLITLTAACTAILATISIAKAQDPAAKDSSGEGPRHRQSGIALEDLTKTLDLTPEQQAKINPIVEQEKPQVATIRQEARQKIKAVRDNIMLQIRPLLTPPQQQKWDASQKAHEDMRKPEKKSAERQSDD